MSAPLLKQLEELVLRTPRSYAPRFPSGSAREVRAALKLHVDGEHIAALIDIGAPVTRAHSLMKLAAEVVSQTSIDSAATRRAALLALAAGCLAWVRDEEEESAPLRGTAAAYEAWLAKKGRR